MWVHFTLIDVYIETKEIETKPKRVCCQNFVGILKLYNIAQYHTYILSIKNCIIVSRIGQF